MSGAWRWPRATAGTATKRPVRRPAPSWSIDLRHLPPVDPKARSAPGSERAAFTRALVEAATSRLGEPRWRTAVRCIGGDGSERCAAPIEVTYDGADSITWSCTGGCRESGTVNGFVGSEHDLSVFVILGPELEWSLDESVYELLERLTCSLPELRGVVVRAEPTESSRRLLVSATAEELEDISALVDHLIENPRSEAEVALASTIRRSLSGVLRKASSPLR